MIMGQIRTLKNFSWFANMAVWFNLLVIFTSMGFIARSPPNYAAAKASYGIDPSAIVTHTFVSAPLYSKVNGIMNMVVSGEASIEVLSIGVTELSRFLRSLPMVEP
jgi:hypothetical protein